MRRLVNVQEESDAELQKLANEHDAALLAFVGSYLSPSPKYAQISMVDEFGVEEVLGHIAGRYRRPRTKRRLYLLVNTVGGSLASSFTIAMAIRRTFGDITVFVPHIAASGGTLMALVGDTIRMGPMSQLGPLDPQVPYGGSYVSANSMLAAQFDLERRLAGKSMQDISLVERQLLESLDGVLMEEHARALDAGEAYLNRVLRMAGYEDSERDSLCEWMLFRLPSHDFVIQADLAKYIGIKVASANVNLREWGMMRDWLSKYIDKADSRHYIRYVVPNAK